jgi:UDP-GlcNAc:undecaprenyl-phosphate GlcNAc-1-phosphate transferase
LAIVTVFFLAVLFFVQIDAHVLALLFGALLIAGVSFADDMFNLSPLLRLCVQVLAALVLVFAGVGITSISNPFGPSLVLDAQKFVMDFGGGAVVTISLLVALFTIVWILWIVNTMNWLDGLNGLPSGVSAIAALTLFFLSVRPGIHFDASNQVTVATMSIILFGTAAAFAIFDFYPAKILMGDTGSMFLGFVLATLAIFSGGKVTTAFLVLGFPILDAFWVIMRRIVQGKSPFKGDLKHLHHRLIYMGLSPRKAVLLMYGLSAFFGLMAVFLDTQQKVFAVGLLFLAMVILAVVAVLQGKKNEA